MLLQVERVLFVLFTVVQYLNEFLEFFSIGEVVFQPFCWFFLLDLVVGGDEAIEGTFYGFI